MVEQCKDIETKIDRHLEVYAENGKELKRLAMAVEFMAQQSEKRERRAEERDRKVDEIFAAYQDFKFGKRGVTLLFKITAWLFGILTAIGGAILMVKGILK